MTLAAPLPDIEIRGLTADSRQVRAGYLFAALPGAHADGRAFIGDAVARGAVAVLAPTGTVLEGDERSVPLIADENPRRRLALMAARFCGAQPATVAAVTGTNGKTSVAWFTRQIWERLGYPSASLGTLGLVPARPEMPASLTTPDPVELHTCLAALAGEGIDHVALEASSHGLQQYRLDGVRFAAAAFTNLSRDHLDYHVSEDAYFAAKSRLFSELLPAGATAVLNIDAPQSARLKEIAEARGQRLLTFGRHADLGLVKQEPLPDGQRIRISAFGKEHEVALTLMGDFQAYNLLGALGLVVACGADAEAAAEALAHVSGVPGRMEFVARTAEGGTIVVDYAHTPDALETVLRAVRPHVAGKLVAVFGCGGDRDPGKRPLMGEIGVRLADIAVVTDDNPRSEDPARIRSEILAAAPGAREIGERREAIFEGTRLLEAGDVLLIAGKGHEPGQIVGDRVLPFDDREVAREAARSGTVGGSTA